MTWTEIVPEEQRVLVIDGIVGWLFGQGPSKCEEEAGERSWCGACSQQHKTSLPGGWYQVGGCVN